MPRTLIAIVLSTLVVPAIATAQHPADSARAHPAPSAHANAVAGQADAARIESCTNLANALIDDLERDDAKAATANFDATMRANLGADKLGVVWKQVGDQMGKLQSRGMPQNMMYQDHTVVTLPLHFERGDVNAQVACNVDGKIAGFFLRRGAVPAPSTSSR